MNILLPFAVAASVLLSACATQTVQDKEPLRVVEAMSVLVVSFLPAIDSIPQSIGDRIATTGSDIKQFNAALDARFGNSIVSSLRGLGVKAQITRSASKEGFPESQTQAQRTLSTLIPIIYCGRPKCPLATIKDVPELAVTIKPTEIKMNIPGSYSGQFQVAVVEVNSGQTLWVGTLTETRLASAKAHEEVGVELGRNLATKLKTLGFIAATKRESAFYRGGQP